MPITQESDNVSSKDGCESVVQPGVEGRLWRFSTAFYAEPGVAERCLALQDGHGWDVNLALFALWLAAERRRPSEAALSGAAAMARAWRAAAVEPLRQARRALKPEAEADFAVAELRSRIKAIELEAERLQQARLAAAAPPPSDGRDRFSDRAAELLARFGALQGGAAADGAAAPLIDALIADAARFVDASERQKTTSGS